MRRFGSASTSQAWNKFAFRHASSQSSGGGSSSTGGSWWKSGSVLLGAGSVGLVLGSENVRASSLYRTFVDQVGTPLMRCFDPETAHGLTINMLRIGFGPVYQQSESDSSILKCEGVFPANPSLSFDTPTGLAAGFDKQCNAPDALLKMGFGFVEIGGVPPEPQPGNAKPRMWRYPDAQAVINCFGLNSEGAKAVAERLAGFQRGNTAGKIVGVNLAKNSTTPGEKAADDYVKGVETFAPLSTFVTLNVSCPNVKWQGSLGETEDIVKRVCDANKQIERKDPATGKVLPKCLVFLKLSPDLEESARKAFADLAVKYNIDALVIGNTTSTRPEVEDPTGKEFFANKGGLSGRPLKEKALQSVQQMYRETNGQVPIIGCGGIENGQDAYNMIRSGASLTQFYTAMVFQGPGAVGKINNELEALLRRDGYKNIQDAVGADNKVSKAEKKKGWL